MIYFLNVKIYPAISVTADYIRTDVLLHIHSNEQLNLLAGAVNKKKCSVPSFSLLCCMHNKMNVTKNALHAFKYRIPSPSYKSKK